MHTSSFRVLLGVCAFALTLVAATPTADALYCNRRIVDTGDSPAYVRTLCGEPTSYVSRLETRTQVVQGRGGVVVAVLTQTVRVDVWLYDFGPNRFMVELVFEDGVLGSERTLGYGTVGQSPPGPGRQSSRARSTAHAPRLAVRFRPSASSPS